MSPPLQQAALHTVTTPGKTESRLITGAPSQRDAPGWQNVPLPFAHSNCRVHELTLPGSRG